MTDVTGENSNETINGTSAADNLYGLNGADVLNGGDGADILYGNSLTAADILAANPDLSYNSTTNSFYEFVSGNFTHGAAEAGAAASSVNGIDGHLAVVTSAVENAFVLSLTGGSDAAWISGSDSGTEGEWFYEDGPEAGQQFWTGGPGSNGGGAVGGAYTNWQAGSEPSNGNAGWDYLYFRTDGTWWSYDVNQTVSYVIEWNDLVASDDNAADTLTGGNGNDILYGQGGNDLLIGGADNDTIYGGEGEDNIQGGTGIDVLYGDSGNDTIDGGTGDDAILGGTGDDSIDGGIGNDALNGGAGADTINGGDGDDFITNSASTVPDDGIYVIEAENFDTITAGVGHEWVVEARSGASEGTIVRVDNNGGNNTFIGRLDEAPELTYEVTFDSAGTYYVWMRGYGPNGGDDSAYIGLDGTLLTNAGGMTFGNPSWSGSTWTGGTFRIEFDIDAPGTHTINLWPREDGISIDKIIITDDINYTPSGLGPSENVSVLNGDDGNDTINGGDSVDEINGGDDNDIIDGGGGADIIGGDNGNDTIDGGNGNDTIDGDAGADTLNGGDGADTVNGGTGEDTINGGNGEDDIDGGSNNDTVDGGAGDDAVDGGAGEDLVEGGAGNDTLSGGNDDDFIVDADYEAAGGFDADGDDSISGDAGDDILVATSGADQMWGGAGEDTFVFTPFDTVLDARVYDFVQGTDLLYLIDLTPSYQIDTNYIFDFDTDFTLSVSGGNSILSFANGSQIQIDGVTSLTVDDFDPQHFF